MKERLRIFPMKVLAAFSLLMGFASIFLLLGRSFLPENPLFWYLFPMSAWVWGILSYLFPGKGRAVWTGIGLAGLLAAAWFFIVPIDWAGVLFVIPCLVMLVMLPLGWSQPVWGEWHIGVWIVGVLIHLLAYALGRRESFSGIAVPLSISFAIFAFLLVLTLNRQDLRSGMHGKEKAPPALRSRNRMLVIALFIPALLASTWGLLGKWLDQIWHWLMLAIGQLIRWFLELFDHGQEESVAGGAQGGGDMMLGFGESAEPSALAKLLEKIFVWVAVAMLAVAAVLVCIFLYKKIKRLLQILMDKLRQYAQAAGEDYVDEMESTLNLDEKAQAFKDKLQKIFVKGPREPSWNELSGREKIRRLYQQFLQKKPKIRGMTAREALSREGGWSGEKTKEFTTLYEMARYSDHEVSDETADQLREKLR